MYFLQPTHMPIKPRSVKFGKVPKNSNNNSRNRRNVTSTQNSRTFTMLPHIWDREKEIKYGKKIREVNIHKNTNSKKDKTERIREKEKKR